MYLHCSHPVMAMAQVNPNNHARLYRWTVNDAIQYSNILIQWGDILWIHAKLCKKTNVCPCWVRPRKWCITSALEFSSTYRRLTPVFVSLASYRCQGPRNLRTKQPVPAHLLKCTIDHYGKDMVIFSGSECHIEMGQRTALWSATE